MIDVNETWPDHKKQCASFFKENASSLREWANASPLRAIDDQEKFIWVARNRTPCDQLGARDRPAEPGELFAPTIDLVEFGAGSSFFVLPRGVTVESIISHPDGFALSLHLADHICTKLAVNESSVTLTLPCKLRSVIPFNMDKSQDGLIEEFEMLLTVGSGKPLPPRDDPAEIEHHDNWCKRIYQAFLKNAPYDLYGVPQNLESSFYQVMENHRLSNYAEALSTFARRRITLVPEGGSAEDLTQLGGLPHLSKGESWPKQGDAFYSFVAQIDLRHLPQIPGLSLPQEGLLSFFSGSLEDAGQPGGKVLFQLPPFTKASPLPPGARFLDFEQDRAFAKQKVGFVAVVDLPPSESFPFRSLGMPEEDEFGDVFLRYEEAREELAKGIEEQSHLGGYSPWADPVPELVFHQVGKAYPGLGLEKYLNDADSIEGLRWWEENIDHVATELHQWRSLLSLASNDVCGMSWWDWGRLEFLIHTDDLTRQSFDKVTILLESP